MKRKIFDVIKQVFCRHEYEFAERMWLQTSNDDYGDIGDNYLIYRCRKCGKPRAINTWDVLYEIEHAKILKVLDYPVEKLVLPKKFRKTEDVTIESKAAAYIIAKYYKDQGILLTEYGNKTLNKKED